MKALAAALTVILFSSMAWAVAYTAKYQFRAKLTSGQVTALKNIFVSKVCPGMDAKLGTSCSVALMPAKMVIRLDDDTGDYYLMGISDVAGEITF